MFIKNVRKQILNNTLLRGEKNPSQKRQRIKGQLDRGIRDLTLAVNELPEEIIEDIFTKEKLEPLIRAILEKKDMRNTITY